MWCCVFSPADASAVSDNPVADRVAVVAQHNPAWEATPVQEWSRQMVQAWLVDTRMPSEVLEFLTAFTGRALEALYREASAAGGASGIKDPKDQLGSHKFALYAALEELFCPAHTPPAAKASSATRSRAPRELARGVSRTETTGCDPVPSARPGGEDVTDTVPRDAATRGGVVLEAAFAAQTADGKACSVPGSRPARPGDVEEERRNYHFTDHGAYLASVDVAAATSKASEFLEKIGSLVTPVATFVGSVMDSAPWLGCVVKACSKLVEGVQGVYAAKESCLELAEIAWTVAATLDKHKSRIRENEATTRQVQQLEDALEEGVALVNKFSKRSFLVKIYFCRRTEEEFQEVTTNILRQVDLLQFDVVADVSGVVNDVSADVQTMKNMVAEIQSRVSAGGMSRNDEDNALRRKIEDLGGMSAVLSSDAALGEVVASMGAQGQVVAGLAREVAASMEQLLEFHRKGTHSIIRNDELRVFWSEEIKGNEVDTKTFVRKLAAWLRGVSFEHELASSLDDNSKTDAKKLVVELIVELDADDVSIATFKVNPSLVDSVFPANKNVADRVREILGNGVTYCTVPELPDPLQQREDDVETVVEALDEKPVAVVHGSPGSGRRVLAHIIAREVMKDHPAGLLHVDLKEMWRSEEDIVKEVGLQLGRDWKQARDMTDFLRATTRVHRGSVLLVITGVTSELWKQARRKAEGRGLRPLVTGLLQRFKEQSLQVLGQRQGVSILVTSEAELDVEGLEEDIKKAVRHISVNPLDERDLAKLRSLRHAPSRASTAEDDGLSDEQRDVLVCLGVFTGSFDIEAATAVLDRLDAAALLRELVEAGYVQLWQESGRWELDEEARRLAQTHAGSAGREEVAQCAERRFIAHIEKIAGRLKEWTEGSEQLQARMIFMRERHNILRATEICSDDHYSLLSHSLGGTVARQDQFKDAMELFDSARRIQEKAFGPEHPDVAETLADMGGVMVEQDRLDEAMRLYERALHVFEQACGSESPGAEHTKMAKTLACMGGVMHAKDKLDDAMQQYERALRIFEKVHGTEHSEVAATLVCMGSVMHDQDKPVEGMELYDCALEMLEKLHGPEHTAVATALADIGQVMRKHNKLDEAMKQYVRALGIEKQAYGPDHTAVAMTLVNMGGVMRDQGKLDDAMELYEHALRIEEKAYGPEHSAVAGTIARIGCVVRKQGKLDDAMRLYERARGTEHTEVSGTLHRIGKVMRGQDKLDDAMRLYKRMLGIEQRVYGPEHSEVAATLVCMGSVMRDQNKPDAAMRLYKRALRIYEEKCGPESKEVATTLDRMGKVMEEQDKLDDAMRVYERLLLIEKIKHGPEHSAVADTLVCMGIVKRKQDKLDEAMRLFKRAQRIDQKVHEAEHSEVAMTLVSTGRVVREQDKLDDAMRLYERALRILEQVGKLESEDEATTLLCMGDVMRDQDKLDDAMQLYERALQIYKEKCGPESKDVATTLNNMANVMRDQGKLDDAMRLYERALRIRYTKYGPEHSEVATTLADMGVMRKQDDLDKAMELFERALRIREQVYGPEHSAVAVTLVDIGDVKLEQGHLDDAMRLYERALRIQEQVYGPEHSKVAAVLQSVDDVRKKVDAPRRSDCFCFCFGGRR
ncbi:unnamed protein product [Pedinophyceae sp. YPF-701]|nr:unnamed protein product [Pedinophyceae sp. YPF-701]